VATEQQCHSHFINKEFVWLIAGHFNPVFGRGTVSAFSGLSRDNQMGGHPKYIQLSGM
jgi:hypothetical protein